jgi:hypothetical protein
MKWLFSSGGYLKVYKGHKEAWFNIDDDLKIRVAWTVGEFTPDDWDKILACVKEAKKILRRIKRI